MKLATLLFLILLAGCAGPSELQRQPLYKPALGGAVNAPCEATKATIKGDVIELEC